MEIVRFESFIKLILMSLMYLEIELITVDDVLRNGSPCKNSCKTNSKTLCSCDAMCFSYNDCCFDSAYVNVTSERKPKETCSQIEGFQESLYLVQNCSQTWKGREIVKEKCHQKTDLITGSIYDKLPVTNLKTNITYKNFYCAKCNYDVAVKPWNLHVDGINDILEAHPDHSIKNIIKKARFYLEHFAYGVELKSQFFILTYKFEIPKAVRNRIRYCHSLVSNCELYWPDAETSQLCQNYTDPIYIAHKSYRNVHCALCNYVSRTSYVACKSFESVNFLPLPESSVHLHFNIDQETLVPSMAKCGSNRVYDSVSGKCKRAAGSSRK